MANPAKTADLHRMVLEDHTCPYGLKARHLLNAQGLTVPVAMFIGTIGAVSVFKAVYIEKRELKCACVGGTSRVPLGFVSLTENLAMIGMAVWMLVRLA